MFNINMSGANILLGVIGFSAGVIVAGGLFSFIIGLGVISDFADRTHTGEQILLYEDSVALGGMIGNFVWIYNLAIPAGINGALGVDAFELWCWRRLKSPLDSKEIQPVHPKGDRS